MATVTGQIPQGNCRFLGISPEGHYLCAPMPDDPNVDPRGYNLFLFYCKIQGKPGETLTLRLVWPPFDPTLGPPRKYNTDPFFTAAHTCMFRSDDQLHWQRLEQVQTDGQAWTLTTRLTLTGPECFVSVNLYYTLAMYRALDAHLAKCPQVQTLIPGHAYDGQPIRLYRVTDPAVPDEGKQHIYLQGLQHGCEFGGGHVLDGALRYLTGGSPEANALLKQYVFHIVPVLCVGDWSRGLRDYPGKDPNMDWDTLQDPETQVIHRYLSALPKKPALLLDLHNGWGRLGRDHGCVSQMYYMSPESVAQQERFARLVWENCDYMTPGKVLSRKEPKPWWTFAMYALHTYGPGFTLELDRCQIYDRAQGSLVPLEQARLHRVGKQLMHTADTFIKQTYA